MIRFANLLRRGVNASVDINSLRWKLREAQRRKKETDRQRLSRLILSTSSRKDQIQPSRISESILCSFRNCLWVLTPSMKWTWELSTI